MSWARGRSGRWGRSRFMQDMNSMGLDESSFDLVWLRGFIHHGIREALKPAIKIWNRASWHTPIWFGSNPTRQRNAVITLNLNAHSWLIWRVISKNRYERFNWIDHFKLPESAGWSLLYPFGKPLRTLRGNIQRKRISLSSSSISNRRLICTENIHLIMDMFSSSAADWFGSIGCFRDPAEWTLQAFLYLTMSVYILYWK